jgi:hypothetical protein
MNRDEMNGRRIRVQKSWTRRAPVVSLGLFCKGRGDFRLKSFIEAIRDRVNLFFRSILLRKIEKCFLKVGVIAPSPP